MQKKTNISESLEETLCRLIRSSDEYDIQKIIEKFKKLKCRVYISYKRIRLEFPDNINKFHKNELSLAFDKVHNAIGETLRHQNLDKLAVKGVDTLVRVI